MNYLPLFFDLRSRRCVVAGDGAIAVRKAEALLRAGARVHLVTATPDETLLAFAREAGLPVARHAAGEGDFEGCAVAIVAVDDPDEAARVARAAAAHTTAVNVVDRPELCTCIMPAIVDRSPVVVAVSTGGAAPVLGRLLRARLESLLPARLGELAALARSLRPEVARRLSGTARRRFWESVLQGPVAELACQGRLEEARAAMLARLGGDAADEHGEVYLVAAPANGDPESLTLRGLRLLQQADLVFHDADLPVPVLDLVRRDAQRRTLAGSTPTTEAAAALVADTRSGRRVALLSARLPREVDTLAGHLATAGIACESAV
jgi:uroporphyrin-III C-methyltransferase/precorrin-2 dehydrogenase/sirohydrochlorin ferrochelatase